MTTAIEVHGITKYYKNRAAVDHLELTVHAGEIFGFLGPNGSGKTTTIRMLTTVLPPDEGTATILGHDLRADPLAIRREVGFMPQRGGGYWFLNLEDNIRLHLFMHGLMPRQANARVARVLDDFGLREHRGKKMSQLSGGFGRRMQIARVLAVPRPILFLDEPTIGLDPVARRQIWDALLRARDDGATIFLCTQYMEEAEAIADRVCLIGQGRVVACDSAASLCKRLGKTALRLTFRAGVPAFVETALAERDGVVSVQREGETLVALVSEDAGRVLPGFLRSLDGASDALVSIDIVPARLEDVYLHLFQEESQC